jgi:hypothetical protein
MKKNLTKKLMLSVLTLAFAVVSLGASTFAWFTLDGNANIGKFEADVVGGYGLDVSVTEYKGTVSKWYTGAIPAEDIAAAIVKTTGKADWQFDAATPAEALTASQSFKNVEGGDAKGSYAIFDLHFKLTDATTTEKFNLYLNKFDVTASNQEAWTVDHEYALNGDLIADGNGVEPGADGYVKTYKNKVALNSSVTYSVESAARIAFIEGTTGYNKVYQQANNAVVAAGNNTVGFNEFGAWNYYAEKLGATNKLTYPASNPNETLEGTNTWSGEWAEETEVVRENLTGGDIVVLTVIVWIEGWDGECINAIFAQHLAVELAFGIKQLTA